MDFSSFINIALESPTFAIYIVDVFLLGIRRLTQVLPLYSQLKIFSGGIPPDVDILFNLSQKLFKSKSVLENDSSNFTNEVSCLD